MADEIQIIQPGEISTANEINHEHDLFVSSARTGLEHAVRCGELLIEAKQNMPHGGWKVWVDENCNFSYRTAQVYMRIYTKAQSSALLEEGESQIGILKMLAAKEKEEKKKKRAEERQSMANQVIGMPLTASIVTGDFRDIMPNMPENSIDMIFTDPPYDEQSISLYGDMARLAAKVLKPGGSLITYVGHYAIIRAGQLMSDHLRFWWTIAVKHTGGSARLPGKWVYVEWKPMLWFVKSGRNNNNYVADFIESKPPTKDEHDWQQDVTEAEYYIDNLTMPGGTVLDPFCGSGTTILAALNIGRQGIGIEKDEDTANIARARLSNYARSSTS